jgi:hypothetical protein
MASRYTITLVVGSGYPGHASIQINGPSYTTYAGMGPVDHGWPHSDGRYDVVTLPNGVGPVGALHDPTDEYSYVDASHYPVKSYTFEVSEEQALDARNAALNYQRNYPSYSVVTAAVCTDYALAILHAALPETDLSQLSRIPSVLQRQLSEASQNSSTVSFPMEGDKEYKYNTHLPSFQPDAAPPNFSSTPPKYNQLELVPFNFAGGGINADVNSDRSRDSALAGASANPRFPLLRELQKYRGSAAPDGPASPSVQGAAPATPAFQPDAVYSPDGDFIGNFPRASAGAPASSPAAFNETGSGSGPRMAGDFRALAQGVGRLLNGADQFIGNGAIVPANAASPSGPLSRGPIAPNLPSTAPIADQSNPAYFSGSNGSPIVDTNGLSLSTADMDFPSLGRRIADKPPASIFDAGAPGVPFVPPAYLNSVGGLSGLPAPAAGIDPMNPKQAAAPPQTGGVLRSSSSEPLRYGSNTTAPISDAGAPAALFALPDSLKFTGDIADWLAALAGVDRMNPTQAASSPQDDQLRGLYRDDPIQAWFVQGRR